MINKIPFSAYKGNEPYIFISYSHKDTALVFPIISELHRTGYNLWYDEGIDPGNEWPEEVGAALGKCALFVVFISPNSINSINVRNEINFALKRDTPFIAIYLQDTELTDGLELQIGAKQAIMKHHMDGETFYYKVKQSFERMGITLDDKPAADAPVKTETTATPVDKTESVKPAPKEPKAKKPVNFKAIAATIGCVIIAATLFFTVRGLTTPNEPAPDNAPDVTANAPVTAPVDVVPDSTVPNAPTVPETKETIPDAPKTDAPVSIVPEPETKTKEPEPKPAVIETKPEPEPETVPEAPVTYTAEEIYAMNGDAVFEIIHKDVEDGTGFFISSNGLAMTAYHVVSYPDDRDMNYETLNTIDNLSVKLVNDDKLDIEEIVYANAEQDIVIFRVKNPNNRVFPYLKINTNDTPKRDDEIFTMGHIQTNYPYLSKGTIYGFVNDFESPQENDRIYYVKNKLGSNADVHYGNSGGPVINNKNQVIGIIFANDPTPGNTYCIITRLTPIDALIKELLP